MIERRRLPRHQRRERRGQVLRARQRRALHQHRHDRHAAAEGSRDLLPHEVRGIVEPARPRGIANVHPLPPDDDQHRRCVLQRPLEHLDEVGARLDGFDVEEDAIGAEALLQVIGEPSGLAGRVVATIADEDPAASHGRKNVSSRPADITPIHAASDTPPATRAPSGGEASAPVRCSRLNTRP